MPTLNVAAANAQADNLGTDYASAVLTIYSGTPPANANAPLSGNTALVAHDLNGFGSATNGTITAASITDELITASGTASFARVVQADRTMQLTLGTSGSEVTVSSTSYVLGGVSEITSMTLTQPQA